MEGINFKKWVVIKFSAISFSPLIVIKDEWNIGAYSEFYFFDAKENNLVEIMKYLNYNELIISLR